MKPLLFSIALLSAFTVFAQDNTPTITVRKNDAVNVALPPLTGPEGEAATKVLQNDLAISGWVEVVPSERGTFTIKGVASGGSITGEVTDRGGKILLTSTYSGGSRLAAHQFADDIVRTLTGKKGIATSKIAFIATRTGKKEVYTADYDGANVQQITHDNGISVSPSISPDGRRLVYTGYQSGYADVYSIDLASGSRNRIIKFPGTNSGASFSNSGSQLAVTLSKDGNPELYVCSSGGGGTRRLSNTRGVEASPSWSGDDSQIVYTSDDGGSPRLYRIPSGGGTPSPLNTGFGYNTEPSWSPDGSKIAFNSRSGGAFVIGVIDLSSGGVRTLSTGGSAEDPSWGPGSRHLIYSQGGSLHIIDTVNGKTFNVISGVGRATEPSWSRR